MAFDSRQYEWADLTVIMGGKDITKIRGIKYAEKADREPVFAKGRYAHSVQTGNISVEGEITMLQSDLESMVAAASGKSLLSLNIDVEASYGNPPDANVTDRIIGVRFSEVPKELKQGDKFMEITLPFVALRVQNQA